MAEYSDRLNDNIIKLKAWIEEFEEIIPDNFEDYRDNRITIAACERYVERIVEEMVIISNIIIRKQGIILREKCFTILADLGLISSGFANKLEEIKGMRNIMVHQYGTFDERVFFESLKDLIDDARVFIESLNASEM